MITPHIHDVEKPKDRAIRHGHARRGQHTRTYNIWEGLRKRCEIQTNHAYKYYGARGITICDEWRTFEGFLASMGECPDGLTLERTDNDAGYFPSNCVWADRATQAKNRRNVHHITVQGLTMTIHEWAEKTGLSYMTIYQRLRKGATAEAAIGRGWYSRGHQSAEGLSRKPK